MNRVWQVGLLILVACGRAPNRVDCQRIKAGQERQEVEDRYGSPNTACQTVCDYGCERPPTSDDRGSVCRVTYRGTEPSARVTSAEWVSGVYCTR